ncbi:MAG: AAA domain-containing protein [Verrucomicrobiota bacterium]
MASAQDSKKNSSPAAVLQTYLNRLHQTTRRSGLLQAFPTTGFKRMDLMDLALASPAIPRDLLVKLLRSEHGKVSFDLDLTEPAPGQANPQREMYRRLSAGLARTAEAFRRETGVRSLWLAYPLFHARVKDAMGEYQSVLAPVFLWPIRIEVPCQTQGRIVIARDEEAGGAKYNKALDIWITDNLEFNPEDPRLDVFDETTLEELEKVVTTLYAGLRPPPTVSLTGPPVPVPARATLAKETAPGVINAGIIGLIQWEKQALTYDLDSLLRTQQTSELLSDYLTGKGRAQLPPSVLPAETDRFLITDTDPAQERAVWQARHGPGLLVHGPPGTGKSQTIVNIVADALAHGQRVLVICQKRAAIDVVAARLTAQGMSDLFCVVHDSEANRAQTILAVKEQVAALRAPEQPPTTIAQRTQLATDIDRLEKQLNDYSAAVCVTGPCGIPYRDLLSEVSRLFRVNKLRQPSNALKTLFKGRTSEELRSLQTEISAVAQLWQSARPKQNPWVHRTQDFLLDPIFRERVQQSLSALRVAHQSHAAFTAAAGLGVELHMPPAEFVKAMPAWARQIEEGMQMDRIASSAQWLEKVGGQGEAEMTAMAEALHTFIEANRALAENAGNPNWTQRYQQAGLTLALEWAGIIAGLLTMERAWWRWFSPVYHLHHFKLKKAFKLNRRFTAEELQMVFGDLVFWLETQAKSVDFARSLKTALTAEPALDPVLKGFQRKDSIAIRKALNQLEIARKRAVVAAGVFTALEPFQEWLRGEYLDTLRQQQLRGVTIGNDVETMTAGFESLESLQKLDLQRGRWQGLGRDVLAVLEQEEPSHPPVGDYAERWWHVTRLSAWYAWIEECQARWPALKEMTVPQYDETRRQLGESLARKRTLEVEHIKQHWKALQLQRRKADFGGVLVSRGPNSKRLRQVVELGEPAGLFDFRPCWLTNPNTASQIFPLQNGFFDVVIFDEASQCPVEQAVPAIFRAKRLVVAGDEKQLPPTAFFQSSFSFGTEDLDLEEAAVAAEAQPDLQRQIEVANAEQAMAVTDLLEASKPLLHECLLSVHYRSAYPQLIQFSNHAFYGGQLQVPPACRTVVQGSPPLVLKEVNGIYEKNCNRIEAQKVIGVLRQFWMVDSVPPTIGIVTFNERQRDLIEDLLMDEAAKDPAFEVKYLAERNRAEGDQDVGFFVKNLESVQGDERDVMIFSTTFGRDAAGQFRRFFGPINLPGGERRLNVAITRAKLADVIITSMPLAEISERMAKGAATGSGTLTGRDYLHAYLHYAKAVSGNDAATQEAVLENLVKLTSAAPGGPDPASAPSLFEQEVREALEARGLRVVPQIGESGFRIDLAVLHPEPDRGYLLGIECDGKTYHPDWTPRARDLWRQRLLKQRGWTIHRVWSTDWWINREQELNKILSKIKTLTDLQK